MTAPEFSGGISVSLGRIQQYFTMGPEAQQQYASWSAFPHLRAPLPTPKLGEHVNVYGMRDAWVTEIHPDARPPYYVVKGVITTRPPAPYWEDGEKPVVPDAVEMEAEIWEEY